MTSAATKASANKFDQKQKFETGVNCPWSIVRGQLSGVKSKCYLNYFDHKTATLN